MREPNRAEAAFDGGDAHVCAKAIDIPSNGSSFCGQPIEALLIAPTLEGLKVFPISSQRVWGIGSHTRREDFVDRAIETQTSISHAIMSEYSSQKPGGQASGEQIRAARALLGMSSKELADVSGVGWATIRRFEQMEGIPRTRSGTLDRLVVTLKTLGVEFLGDPIESPGVRLHRRT